LVLLKIFLQEITMNPLSFIYFVAFFTSLIVANRHLRTARRKLDPIDEITDRILFGFDRITGFKEDNHHRRRTQFTTSTSNVAPTNTSLEDSVALLGSSISSVADTIGGGISSVATQAADRYAQFTTQSITAFQNGASELEQVFDKYGICDPGSIEATLDGNATGFNCSAFQKINDAIVNNDENATTAFLQVFFAAVELTSTKVDEAFILVLPNMTMIDGSTYAILNSQAKNPYDEYGCMTQAIVNITNSTSSSAYAQLDRILGSRSDLECLPVRIGEVFGIRTNYEAMKSSSTFLGARLNEEQGFCFTIPLSAIFIFAGMMACCVGVCVFCYCRKTQGGKKSRSGGGGGGRRDDEDDYE
jgi:hypothetical protein